MLTLFQNEPYFCYEGPKRGGGGGGGVPKRGGGGGFDEDSP